VKKLTECGLRVCTIFMCLVFGLAHASERGGDVIRQDDRIESTYVLHYAPVPSEDAEAVASELLDAQFATLQPSAFAEADRPAVHVVKLDMQTQGLKPPALESLKLYTYGVTQEQAEALQKSSVAVVLAFAYQGRNALQAMEQANAFAYRLATRTQALIWDAETRELFSPAAWSERRMATSDAGLPEVRKHIAIRAYQTEDRVRTISSGMRKFGLPDIVVNDVPWWLTQPVGDTMRLLAQALVEGPPPALGTYDFDVCTIRQQRIRTHIEASLVRHPTSPVALLALRPAAPTAGDPDNRLIEITFDRYPGRTVYERYSRFTSEFFGPIERASSIGRSYEVLAAID
jgi:hypothetical protein